MLVSSPALPEPLPVSEEARQIMLDGQVTRDVLTLSDDQRLAFYGAPLLRDETVVGVILVAAPLWPIEQTLAQLRVMLASAVLGSVFLAGGIGWLLASAAMRPVDQITAVARAIGRSGDLSGRLPPPRRSDELGRLSVAFNELLERLDRAMAQQRQFLDDASHELRTPLTTIRANASALLRGGPYPPTPSPVREGGGDVLPLPLGEGWGEGRREGLGVGDTSDELRAIARESERMGRLVTDLLALARADAGQLLARRPLMLDALLVDVYQQARYQAPNVRLTHRRAGAGRGATATRTGSSSSCSTWWTTPAATRRPAGPSRSGWSSMSGVALLSVRDTATASRPTPSPTSSSGSTAPTTPGVARSAGPGSGWRSAR